MHWLKADIYSENFKDQLWAYCSPGLLPRGMMINKSVLQTGPLQYSHDVPWCLTFLYFSWISHAMLCISTLFVSTFQPPQRKPKQTRRVFSHAMLDISTCTLRLHFGLLWGFPQDTANSACEHNLCLCFRHLWGGLNVDKVWDPSKKYNNIRHRVTSCRHWSSPVWKTNYALQTHIQAYSRWQNREDK